MTDQQHTTWPQAVELQEAAERFAGLAADAQTNGTGVHLPAEVVAGLGAWMHATADTLAWLAPYRSHEGGYGMWTSAETVARGVNATASEERRPDNPATDDQLREQIQAALRESWTTSGPNVHMDDAIRRDAAAVVPVVTRHTEQLSRDLAEAEDRARRFLGQRQEMAAERYAWQERGDRAESAVARVRDLADRWTQAGPPPLGTSVSRWWDVRLAELLTAIGQPDAATEESR